MSCPVSFSINFPDQITLDSAGFHYISSNGDTLKSHSFANSSAPLFIVNGSSNWNTYDSITIWFSLKTSCCLPASNSQRTYLAVNPSMCIDSTSTSLTVVSPILNATCSFPGNDTDVAENIGSVVDMVFKVKNGGTLPINQFVDAKCPTVSSMAMLGYFFSGTQDTTTDTYRNYCNYYMGPGFVSGNFPIIAADTNVYKTLFGVNYFPIDSLYFHIIYKITGCQDSLDRLNFVLFCSNGSGSDTCFPGVHISTSVAVLAGQPVINPSLLLPHYLDSLSYHANYCNGADTQSVQLGLVFTNSGVDEVGGAKGNSRAVNLKVYLTSSNELGKIDTSSLRINGYHYSWPTGFLTKVPDLNYTMNPLGFTEWRIDFTKWLWSCSESLPFGPNSLADLDGNGELDDLSNTPGQNTFTITVNYIYQPESNLADTAPFCPLTFFSTCGQTDDELLYGTIGFQNQCNSLPLNSDTAGVVNGYSYGVISGGTAQLNILPTHDVVWDATSYFQICPGENKQTWADTGYSFICKHPDHRIVMNLPAGYNVDFSDPSINPVTHRLYSYILLTSTCGCIADSIQPLITQVKHGCDINQAIIDFGLLPKCNFCSGNFSESYNISCFTIPISLTCDSCTNSSRGWDNINYSLDYYCDTSTCLSCASVITCASNVAFHHCEGGCLGSGNDFESWPPFTFRRQTLGWLNTPPSNYYDCNNPPTINVDSVAKVDPWIHLDRAYPGDEILAADSGTLDNSFSNYDTVIFQVDYTTYYWLPNTFGNPSVFDFDADSSSITVISSNHKTAILKYPTLQHPSDVVLPNGKVQMSFTFSADSNMGHDTALKGMLPPYSFLSRIYLIAKTTPFTPGGNTFYTSGAYPLNDLQAQYRGTYDTDYHDTDNSCDPWTANFEMLQPSVAVYLQPSGGYCGNFVQNLVFRTVPALWPFDDFPYEFRPYAALDSNFRMLLSAGYIYDSAQFTIIQDKYSATDTNHFALNDAIVQNNYEDTGVMSLDSLKFNGPTHHCWPLLDCKAGGNWDFPYYQLAMYFNPLCSAADTVAYTAFTGYTTSIQQPRISYQNHFYDTLHDNAIKISPILQLITPSSSDLCTDTVRFTITLQNNNTNPYSAATYAWVALEQTNTSSPPVIFTSATNATYYNQFGTDNMFIMLGSISPSNDKVIQITAIVDTSNGFGCVDSAQTYPIKIVYGNVCTNSPALTQPDTLKGCEYGSTIYNFNLDASLLTLQEIGSLEVDTLHCGSDLKYTFEVSNSGGNTLYQPSFLMNLPSGVTLDTVIFKYPDNRIGASHVFTSDDFNHVTGNLTWNLTSDIGLSNGLFGTCLGSDSNNDVLETVIFHTNCNFNNSITPITFKASGISPCGKVILADSISDAPAIPSSNCPSVTMNSTNDSCNGQSNGAASASVTGGRSPYTYLWNGGLTTDTITGLSPGIYTVTVTDNKGCTVIDSIAIYQPQPLKDSISVVSNINCNLGTLASATTTVSGGTRPYFYTWSPTAQTGDTATGLSTGTYTVTVTDKNGCSLVDSIFIQSLRLTLKDDTISCGTSSGDAIITGIGGTPPYTYLWSNGQTTQSISGLSAGSYSVVVTDSLSCRATDSLIVTGCGACYLQAKYDLIINDSSASSIHAGPITYTCMNILIIGIYTVDEDVTIANCNVAFAPHAMINVINNKTLIIHTAAYCSGFNCPHLYAACDTMWRGIFINPGSNVFINKVALIEDADSALVSINTGTAQGLYHASGVTFNRNYKDIVVETCPATYNGEANGCLFTCRDLSAITPCNYYSDYNSAPFDSLMPPYPLPYSYMGMDIDTVRNITVTYGDIFDNKQYGISTHASSLTVISNLFKNIGFKAGYGAGVLDSGMYDHLNKEFLVVDSNNFYNCYNGIIASDWFTKVTILTDVFIDSISPPGVYGIYVTDMGYPYPNPLNIQENTISNFNTGIEADINNYVNANINYNNISESSCDASITWKGISINEFPHSPCLYNVDENNISSINYGIVAVGVQNSVINDNTIALGAVGCSVINGAGIGMKANGKASQIGCNYISTPDTINSYTGIVESQSINTTIINNTTILTDLHIRFNSTPFNGDNAFDNNLNVGSTGILCSAGAMAFYNIGTPGDPADNSFNSFSICQVTAPASMIYYWHLYNPTSCPGFTHHFLTFPDSNPCILPPSPPIILRRDSIAQTADSLSNTDDSATIVAMKNTALSKDTFTVLQDTNMPLAKKGVATALAQNSYLLSDPVFQHFNDSISNAPMGQILAIDITAASASSSIDYSGLLNNLSAITPASNIEANMQISGIAFLNFKLNHTLSLSQLGTLRTLANKCPDWDGVGVYEARAILSRFDPPGTEYSDSCNTRDEHSVHKKTKTTQTVSQPTFSLYPNPNNGNFTLEYDLGEGILGKVVLYNTIGEQVGEYQLNGSKGKLNISNPELSNGVYIWKLYSNAQIIKFGKVIVIK